MVVGEVVVVVATVAVLKIGVVVDTTIKPTTSDITTTNTN